MRLRLSKESANKLLFFFFLDACEKLWSERLDCFGPVKGHAGINFAAAKVAGLAAGLEDRFDLSVEVDPGRA
jgi:hypothetical protein